MRNFNYTTTYPTREATESHIAAIDREDRALFDIPDSALSYTTAMDIHRHLLVLKQKLVADLNYFNAIDRAMEEARLA